MHPSGSLEPPSVIVVNAPLISASVEQEPQERHEEEVEERREVQARNGEIGEGQRAMGSRYPTKESQPLGDWWLNHILAPPSEVERANVALNRKQMQAQEVIVRA